MQFESLLLRRKIDCIFDYRKKLYALSLVTIKMFYSISYITFSIKMIQYITLPYIFQVHHSYYQKITQGKQLLNILWIILCLISTFSEKKKSIFKQSLSNLQSGKCYAALYSNSKKYPSNLDLNFNISTSVINYTQIKYLILKDIFLHFVFLTPFSFVLL